MSLIGHFPDVTDILINCRIRKIVRKKIIRFTKIVWEISLTVSHVSDKGSVPKTAFSLTSILLTPSIVRVDDHELMPISTPLKFFGIVHCMMLCMLTTRININENHATKTTGLNIISIITSKLRYFIIQPPLSHHSLLLNILSRIINGAPIINTRKKTTLMILAINKSANHIV